MIRVSSKNPSKYFYASNGKILKSLKELLDFLKESSEEEIINHFNEEKNDFANWVKDVLKNKMLANKMYNAKNKRDIIVAIETALKPKLKKVSKKSIISKIKEEFSK